MQGNVALLANVRWPQKAVKIVITRKWPILGLIELINAESRKIEKIDKSILNQFFLSRKID